MPSSSLPLPNGTRRRRPCGEPTPSTPSSSSSSGGLVQPMDINSLNNYILSTSPTSYSFPFSASHPVSAFSSSSSSEGDYLYGTSTNANANFGVINPDGFQSPVYEPLDLNPECQGMFSFEWGPPPPVIGDLTSSLLAPVMGFGELNYALTGLSLSDNDSSLSPQSIANLPHLMTPSAATHVASLPPTCSLCTLPLPLPAIQPISISIISFTNPLHKSVFILTTPSAGIYLYLSSTDMYFHSHPGPLPEQLPGYASQTAVGRVRNDEDPIIWLNTGAGGMRQDWLWTFKDMCRNMRMPPRDTPGWREMFNEEDWVVSVVELGKSHGILVDGE